MAADMTPSHITAERPKEDFLDFPVASPMPGIVDDLVAGFSGQRDCLSELVLADRVKQFAEGLAGGDKTIDPGRLLALALISLTSVPVAKSTYFGG